MNTIITDFPPIASYDLCDSSGVKEADFEEVAQRLLVRLYPECHAFPFRPNVRYDDAVWQPDLAVVDKANGFWFVVEVEVASHHLEKHVLPQVSAFNLGEYGDDAAIILSKALGITESKAKTLLNLIPRQVVVISNKLDARWTEKLASLGVQHLVISTYANRTTAQQVHKVDGELLPARRSLGFGRVRATDGVIVTQAGTSWTEGLHKITGPEGVAAWQCSIANGKAWLMKERGVIEFHDGAIVQFIRRQDGTLLAQLPYVYPP